MMSTFIGFFNLFSRIINKFLEISKHFVSRTIYVISYIYIYVYNFFFIILKVM